MPTLPAAAQATDAAVKTATPSRTRPSLRYRSASRPKKTSSEAYTMAYPLSTQESSLRFAVPRSLAICGRATLTTNRSRLASTTPADTMTSTSPGAVAVAPGPAVAVAPGPAVAVAAGPAVAVAPGAAVLAALPR